MENSVLFLSFYVPTRKNTIAFSMLHTRYWDNSKYLFEYMAEKRKANIDVFWLYDDESIKNNAPENLMGNFIRRRSFKGWYICSAAKCMVVSYGSSDFGYLNKLTKYKKTIMLWHAIMIKNYGLTDNKYKKKQMVKYVKGETSNYDIMISSSDIDRYNTASCNYLNISKVHVTGLPRNDVIFRYKKPKAESIKKTYLYAPTFRDYSIEGSSLFFPFGVELEKIEKWAIANNIQFMLRPHPGDVQTVKHLIEMAKLNPDIFIDVSVNKVPDVTELIFKADGIITDYSSIYIDALILDTPAIFVDFDRAEYIEKRGLAYDYELITPGPKVQSWDGFSAACLEMKAGAQEWAEQREFVRKMFFKYRDDRACERVADLIEKMINDDL